MKAPRIDDLVQDERLASQYLVADFMRYSIVERPLLDDEVLDILTKVHASVERQSTEFQWDTVSKPSGGTTFVCLLPKGSPPSLAPDGYAWPSPPSVQMPMSESAAGKQVCLAVFKSGGLLKNVYWLLADAWPVHIVHYLATAEGGAQPLPSTPQRSQPLTAPAVQPAPLPTVQPTPPRVKQTPTPMAAPQTPQYRKPMPTQEQYYQQQQQQQQQFAQQQQYYQQQQQQQQQQQYAQQQQVQQHLPADPPGAFEPDDDEVVTQRELALLRYKRNKEFMDGLLLTPIIPQPYQVAPATHPVEYYANDIENTRKRKAAVAEEVENLQRRYAEQLASTKATSERTSLLLRVLEGTLRPEDDASLTKADAERELASLLNVQFTTKKAGIAREVTGNLGLADASTV